MRAAEGCWRAHARDKSLPAPRAAALRTAQGARARRRLERARAPRGAPASSKKLLGRFLPLTTTAPTRPSRLQRALRHDPCSVASPLARTNATTAAAPTPAARRAPLRIHALQLALASRASTVPHARIAMSRAVWALAVALALLVVAPLGAVAQVAAQNRLLKSDAIVPLRSHSLYAPYVDSNCE